MTQEVELRIHLKYCQFNGENVQEIKDLVGTRAYDIQIVELRDKEKADGVDSSQRALRIYKTEQIANLVEIGDYVATDKDSYYIYTKEGWHRLLGKETATK